MEEQYDVFISYSRKDYVDEQKNVILGNEVSKIKDALSDAGITYWFDEEGIYSGQNFVEKIVTNIEKSKIFVFLSTANANKSTWTCEEIAIAHQFNKHIIPVRVDSTPCNKKVLFRIADLDYIEYYANPRKGMVDLIRSIKTYLEEIADGIKYQEKYISNDIHERRDFCCPPCDTEASEKEERVKSKEGKFATYEPAPESNGGGVVGKFLSAIGGWFSSGTGIFACSAPFTDNSDLDKVYSSIFAPCEIKRKSHVLIQVYLHLLKETEKVKELASESDKDAERRDYVPLQCKLKNGDTVHIQLNIYGESLLQSETKNVVWQGSFTKCSFDYFVPMDLDVNELSCVALLNVNSVPVGEMRFITKIVEYAPRKLNPEIISHQYNKVFISYSHQDESKVKFLHKGLELGAIPHFFDRKYLKTGDVYPQVIQDYIDSADLFILCWSENASKSEYVQKERSEALKRAFPQVQPEKAAKLRIYPISIEPRTELPDDMKDNYHFGEI